MDIMEVNNLSKSFTYYEKELGLKNSLKNLFHRKKLIKEAVKDVTFRITEGEIVGFLGPNGAGKTTTLKMLTGILYPSGGEVRINGHIPWKREKEFKSQFSIVMGQKSQLWWDLPANESLYLNKCIYEVNDKDYKNIIEELSELLDVKDLLKIQVRRLSLGERMKIELIASLIHSPKILFLDEPTIGLDIVSQRRLREFFKSINQEKKTTIILTSHYMGDIEDLCKRAMIINQGRILYDGELNKLNDRISQNKLVKLTFSRYVDKNDLDDIGVIKMYDGYNVIIEVKKQEFNNFAGIILNKLPVVDYNIENIPIEEEVSKFYGKGVENNESSL